MRAELVQEADPSILRPEGDVVLAEQTDREWPFLVHELRRGRERQPVVLPHEAAHGCVAFDASHQLVLRLGHHRVTVTHPRFGVTTRGTYRTW